MRRKDRKEEGQKKGTKQTDIKVKSGNGMKGKQRKGKRKDRKGNERN